MKLLFCLILLSAGSSVAYAGPSDCTGHPPDCWPEGSAMSVGQTLSQQRDSVEKRLDREFGDLISVVNASQMVGDAVPEISMALKAEQKVWYQYRDAECGLVGALTGAGGTWPSTYAVRCERNLTNQRLRRVRSAIRCVSSDNKKGLGLANEQASCLQQLAPLANRI